MAHKLAGKHIIKHPRSQGLFPTPPPQLFLSSLGGRGREKALGTRMIIKMRNKRRFKIRTVVFVVVLR